MSSKTSFILKIKDFYFIAALLLLLGAHIFLRNSSIGENNLLLLDLLFHSLLSICLWGFLVKKYNPTTIRKVLLAIFLLELVIGVYLKKLGVPYSAEISFIGFLGVLITWYNTHYIKNKSL